MGRLLFPAMLTVCTLILAGCFGMPYVGVGIDIPAGSISLGERFVPFEGSEDVVEVGPDEGPLRSLSFVVEDEDVEITSFVVTYDNGQRERFDRRLVFLHGERMHTFRLPGDARHVRSVSFTYRPLGEWGGHRAHVQVYGER